MARAEDPRLAEHMDSVRAALLERGSATRAELAAQTGLSAMTVGKLLAVMELRGEVCQDELLRQNCGRPSIVARYRGDFAHFATVTVAQRGGESVFAFSVFNLFGERVHRDERAMEDVRPESFDGFFEAAASRGERVRLAVFALPGEARGDSLFISDFEGLMYATLMPRIRARFGVETLFENDVNAAVFGHASGEEPAPVRAGLYFPRRFCPGAGLVIDGRILHGHGSFAGEVTFLHGPEAWAALDYGDEPRVCAMVLDLLTALACTVAPASTALYGDFFTDALVGRLGEGLRKRLRGQFDMRLMWQESIAQDMERGARMLGLRAMRGLLRRLDG